MTVSGLQLVLPRMGGKKHGARVDVAAGGSYRGIRGEDAAFRFRKHLLFL